MMKKLLIIYQDLADLIACAREGNPEITEFDCSVFDGKHVTGDIDEGYLDRLAASRNDIAQFKKNHPGQGGAPTIVDLPNDLQMDSSN